MINERDAAIWTRVLEYVMFCVPNDVRAEVLRRLSEVKPEAPLKVTRLSEAEANENLKFHHAQQEAASLLVQVLARSITNSNSPEGASKILFREHRSGTGSGWLPDYLDSLPGISVDLNHCRKIAAGNGPSKLERREE